MQTKHTRISERKVATMGDAYTRTWIGVPVVFTTYEGERLVGTITHWSPCRFPVATFPDGRWARLDSHVEVVVDAA